jgi:hypothetical protein
MKADAKGLDKDKQKPNLEQKENKTQNPQETKKSNDGAESPRGKTPEKENKIKEPQGSPQRDKSIFKKYQMDAKEILQLPVEIISSKK